MGSNIIYDDFTDFHYPICYIKQKLSNGQTLEFGMDLFDCNDDTEYWNIYAQIYTKRKQAAYNMENCVISGNGIALEAFAVIRKSFQEIEEEIKIHSERKNVMFCCHWTDNRRRNVYEKFLKKYGYEYKMFDGRKELCKIARLV